MPNTTTVKRERESTRRTTTAIAVILVEAWNIKLLPLEGFSILPRPSRVTVWKPPTMTMVGHPHVLQVFDNQRIHGDRLLTVPSSALAAEGSAWLRELFGGEAMLPTGKCLLLGMARHSPPQPEPCIKQRLRRFCPTAFLTRPLSSAPQLQYSLLRHEALPLFRFCYPVGRFLSRPRRPHQLSRDREEVCRGSLPSPPRTRCRSRLENSGGEVGAQEGWGQLYGRY